MENSEGMAILEVGREIRNRWQEIVATVLRVIIQRKLKEFATDCDR